MAQFVYSVKMIGLFVVAAVGLAVVMDLWDLLDKKKYGLTNVSKQQRERDGSDLTSWNVEHPYSAFWCSCSWTYPSACPCLFVLVLYSFCSPQVLGTWRRLHEYALSRHAEK